MIVVRTDTHGHQWKVATETHSPYRMLLTHVSQLCEIFTLTTAWRKHFHWHAHLLFYTHKTHSVNIYDSPPTLHLLQSNTVAFYLSSHFWQGYAPWSVLGWAWWRGGREWKCAGGCAGGCVDADADADAGAGGTRCAGRVAGQVMRLGRRSGRPGNGCWAPDAVSLALDMSRRKEQIRHEFVKERNTIIKCFQAFLCKKICPMFCLVLLKIC